MGKINWFKRSSDPNDLLCVGERFAYACANAGNSWSYILVAGFLTFYYTNVAGLNPGVIGTILLVSRVFDGFSDLIMGTIIDKTKMKMGKARPWILIAAVPYMVATILTFSVPLHASDTAKYIYVFVTYNLLNTVTYTMSNTAVFAQNCLNTSNSEERTKSGIWCQIGSNAVIFIVSATYIKWVTAMGGDAAAWRNGAAAFAAIGTAMLIFSALCTRERVVPDAEEVKIPLKNRLKAVLTNKNWVLFVVSYSLSVLGYVMISGGCLYYCQDILGDKTRQATLSSLQSGLSFVLLILVMSFIVKKLGNVAVKQWSSVFFIIGCAGMLLSRNWTVVIAMYVFIGLGWAFLLSAQGGLMADTSQHMGDLAGFDVSGISNAGMTFAMKIGSGLGSALLGWVLSAFQYDGMKEVQTAQAITGVKVAVMVVPIVIMLIAMLFMAPYDLYKKKGQTA